MKDIALQFIQFINAHDLFSMWKMMTEDHVFVDAHGTEVVGNSVNREGWYKYFQLFPDFTIEITHAVEMGDTVALFGSAGGSYHKMVEASWRLPASWKAVVDGKKIKTWQVYADTKVPFAMIEKFSTGARGFNSVTGIGGVFFKSSFPKSLAQWYDAHLGTKFGDADHCSFLWREYDNPKHVARTTLSFFPAESTQFRPTDKPFMLNYRVENLDRFLAKLRDEGIIVDEKVETREHGKFGWILDPEGNKIELWEPASTI